MFRWSCAIILFLLLPFYTAYGLETFDAIAEALFLKTFTDPSNTVKKVHKADQLNTSNVTDQLNPSNGYSIATSVRLDSARKYALTLQQEVARLTRKARNVKDTLEFEETTLAADAKAGIQAREKVNALRKKKFEAEALQAEAVKKAKVATEIYKRSQRSNTATTSHLLTRIRTPEAKQKAPQQVAKLSIENNRTSIHHLSKPIIQKPLTTQPPTLFPTIQSPPYPPLPDEEKSSSTYIKSDTRPSNPGETKEEMIRREAAILNARTKLLPTVGLPLANALEALANKKTEISQNLSPNNFAVSYRIFAKAVGWQSARGRMRLSMKFVTRILQALLQKLPPPSLREHSKGSTEKSNITKDEISPLVSFVIGAVGSSVTAGHGSWFNDSWPIVLGRELSEPLKAVGVSVDVRNRATGLGGGAGFSFETTAFCMETMLGTGEIDLLLFEFNPHAGDNDASTPHVAYGKISSKPNSSQASGPMISFVTSQPLSVSSPLANTTAQSQMSTASSSMPISSQIQFPSGSTTIVKEDKNQTASFIGESMLSSVEAFAASTVNRNQVSSVVSSVVPQSQLPVPAPVVDQFDAFLSTSTGTEYNSFGTGRRLSASTAASNCCEPRSAEHFETFIRNALSLSGNPVLLQHLGFGYGSADQELQVPPRHNVSTSGRINLLKGEAMVIDVNRSLVLARYKGESGSYFDEWIPISSLQNIPTKRSGIYGKQRKSSSSPYVEMPSPPLYWTSPDGVSLLEKYGEFGFHWLDQEGIAHEVGHLPEFWRLHLNQKDPSAPCGGKAPWNPGPKAHLLHARVLAYTYLVALNDAIYYVLDSLQTKKTTSLDTWLEGVSDSNGDGESVGDDDGEVVRIYTTMKNMLRELDKADKKLLAKLSTDDGAPVSPDIRRDTSNVSNSDTVEAGTNSSDVPVSAPDIHGGRYAAPRCALMPVVAAGAEYFTSPKAVVHVATDRARSQLYGSSGPIHYHVALEKELRDSKDILVDGRAVGAFSPFFDKSRPSLRLSFKWKEWKMQMNARKFSMINEKNQNLYKINNTIRDSIEQNHNISQRQRHRRLLAKQTAQPWQVITPSWTFWNVQCAERAERTSVNSKPRKIPPMDRPWTLYGDESSGWLSLRFKVFLSNTPVAVCQPPCPLHRQCPRRRGSLDKHAEFQLGQLSPRRVVSRFPVATAVGKGSPLVARPVKMLVDGGNCFEVIPAISMKRNPIRRLQAGDYVIRVRVKAPEYYVLLSHLVWF